MNNIEILSRVLPMAQRALAILEEQAAGYTALTIPTHLKIELETKRREVVELETRIGNAAQNTRQVKSTEKLISTAHTPSSLPPNLYNRLRHAFAISSHFTNDANLQTLFVDSRLNPWRDLISDNSPNRAARVTALIETLHDKVNTVDENALVLFLHVLADNTDPADALHLLLLTLAADLEHTLAQKPAD